MDGPGPDAGAGVEMRETEVPTIPLEIGEERNNTCYSWTLENEEPLYINKVRMEGTRGIHHSNWFFVDEGTYSGPDGLWSCSDRDFDTAASALAGGVLFAQSTQAREEVQQFQEGAVVEIPPHSRIVGDLHLLNTYGEQLNTEIKLQIFDIADESVETKLSGFSIDYQPLDIPPRTKSRFTVECNFAEPHLRLLAKPIDFSVHYVLPHYHELGSRLRLEVMGGPDDGKVIWQTSSDIGDPLGGRLKPPYDMSEAEGMRLTCEFDNPRDESVGWGVGDQEMCVAFGFTDSEHLWGASSATHENRVVGETEDGVVLNETDCTVITGRGGG